MKKLLYTMSLIFAMFGLALSVAAAAETVNVSTVSALQSAHPYTNDMDKTWVYTHPTNVESLVITFSSDTELENNYDKVYILDGSGNQIGTYTGTQLSGVTVTVPGNVVKIRLTTDSSVTKNGFTVSSIGAVVTGSCGDNATYTLNYATRELTISGSGAMYDYNNDWPVWADENYNYADRPNVKTVSIGAGITYVGAYAFSGCHSLESFSVDAANTAYVAVDGVLYTKNMTDLVCYPYAKADTSYVLPEGITSIYFGYILSEYLQEITIPASVTEISPYALRNCRALNSILVADGNTTYTSVDGVLFTKDMKTLVQYPYSKEGTSYTIPDGVETVASGAFSFVTTLTAVSFPASVTDISQIYSSKLQSFTVDAANETYASENGILLSKDKTVLVKYPGAATDFVIPASVTEIYYFAFAGCYYLPASITIPETVKSVGAEAFAEAFNLESVVFESAELTLGRDAFNWCRNLSGVYVYATDITIAENGSDIFAGCADDLVIYCYADTALDSYAQEMGHTLSYLTPGEGVCIHTYGVWQTVTLPTLTADGTVERTCSKCGNAQERAIAYVIGGACGENATFVLDDSGTLTISGTGEMYDYYDEWPAWAEDNLPDGATIENIVIEEGITSIGGCAFDYCYSFASVSIPASVTEIGEWGLGGWNSLETITVAEGNESYVVLDDVLFTKDMTQLVYYPYCKTATSYTVPDGVKTIWYCVGFGENLTELVLPASLISFEDNRSESLQSITVDADSAVYTSVDGVLFTKDMKRLVAYPCDKADTVYTVPAGVETINYIRAWNLENLTIPASVTNIGFLYGMASISVDAENTTFNSIDGILFSEDGSTLVSYPSEKIGTTYTVPTGVETIRNDAFLGVRDLVSVTVPATVKEVQTEAFCESYSLLSVTFMSEDTLSLDANAFGWCESLVDVTVHAKTVTVNDDWGGGIFSGCSENLVISCYAGSGLDAYAQEWDIAVKLLSETEEPHEHSYTATVTTAPTCEDTGVKTYTCACSDSYTETIAALGHNYGEWVETRAPQYRVAGEEARTCSTCGAVETQAIPALAAIPLSTAEDIINLMHDSSGWSYDYILTDDIDLADYTGTSSQARIGNYTIAFTGTFNGAGHTISGVNIVTGSADSNKRTGFFGWAAGATIENLTLRGKISSGQDGVGGIVGVTGLKAGTITTIRNCVNYCAVSTSSSYGRIGGIVGTHSANKLANIKLVVENCVNYGTLDAKKHIGGIIGRIEDSSTAATGSVVTIKGCANFGALTAPAANNDGVGGIVGTALPQNGTYTVENCYNAGTVNAPYRVGGIVGSIATYASTTGKMYIKNCVSTADITASYVSGSEGAIGGILGEVFNGGSGSVTIENCFVSGSITGKRTNKGANVGAIIGRTAGHYGAFICDTGNGYAADLLITTAGGAANKTGATAVLSATEEKEYLAQWCSAFELDSADSTHLLAAGGISCLICDYVYCNGESHPYYSWDLSGALAQYRCPGCGAAQDLSAYDTIYVSAGGDDNAFGTASAPLQSFNLAMDIAAKADKDIEVRIIGTVSPAARQIDSEYNTVVTSFEEHPHTNTITVTSAEDGSGRLQFTNAARYYFLYGPTTFENIEIGCDVTSGLYFFGRGFKLTLGEGLTMNDVSGKTAASKTDSGIAGLGAEVEVSDIKVYALGGFCKGGLYAGANAESVSTDLTVLSGEYWLIGGFNRGYGSSQTMQSASAKITVGDVTAVYIIPTAGETIDLVDTDVQVHYKGEVHAAYVYRFAFSSDSMGDGNTANHFFYEEMEGSSFGDFMMGTRYCPTNVNLYYASAVKSNHVVNGCLEKQDKYAAQYDQTGEVLSFLEYCVKYGHSFVSGACSLCGVLECDGTHTQYRWDLSREEPVLLCAACDDVVECGEITAIYVSEDGDAFANGLSADSPLCDFAAAIDIAASQAHDVTVYLIGEVYLPNRSISTQYVYNKHFEEKPHTNTITVTMPEGVSGTMHFSADCQHYFLYGPTVFENLNIGSDLTSGAYIFARGFKLVMGERLSMVRRDGYLDAEKTDANIDGLGATLRVSDLKLYIYGGFYDARSEYTGADVSCYDADVTVLSGEYWAIMAFNRDYEAMNGATASLTLGNITAAYIVPTSTTEVQYDNCTVDVHYMGRVRTCYAYRFTMQLGCTGAGNTVNHFFHKNFSNQSVVGDFGMGSGDIACAVNMYYDVSVENHRLLRAFREKSDLFAKRYNQVGDCMSFPEWCVERGGGHDWNTDEVCTFCGITACENHAETAVTVLVAPTCISVGKEAERCTVCFEHLAEQVLPIMPEAHDCAWVHTETSSACVCVLCEQTIAEHIYADYANVTELHVSDAGTPAGGRTADAPLNCFDTAMRIAAASAENVTVYVHGMATLDKNSTDTYWHDFYAPAHTNAITVKGSGDGATLQFGKATSRMAYVLGGPEIFENIRFSGTGNKNDVYIVANHEFLMLGEGADVLITEGYASYIVGGCLDWLVTDEEEYVDCNSVVIASGTYSYVYASGTGCQAAVNAGGASTDLSFFGDVTVTGDIFADATEFDGAVRDIWIEINGNVTVGGAFAFGSFKENANVIVWVTGGSLTTETMSGEDRLPGTMYAEEELTDRVASLKICVSPELPAVYDQFADALTGADASKYELFWIDELFCEENFGAHTPSSEVVEHLDATCTAVGYDMYFCTACAENYCVEIPMIPHTFGSWELTQAPQVGIPGEKTRICTGCGEKETRVVDALAVTCGAVLTVESVSVSPGDSFAVELCMTENTGFGGVEFALPFDSAALKLTDVQLQGAFAECTVTPIATANRKGMISVTYVGLSNVTGDGSITLTFVAKEDAALGTYTLCPTAAEGSSFAYAGAAMCDFTLVICDGTVEVRTSILGDANGDGRLTLTDVMRVLRAMTNDAVEITDTADYNCDGDIDILDALLILKAVLNA